MKKSHFISVLLLWTVCQFFISSCTKTVTRTVTNTVTDTVTVKDTVITYPITGLWQGTYTSPSNGSSSFELDFSIFADGTLTYYGTGMGNTQFAAIGTWTLSGTNFSFAVTVNSAGIGNGQAETGTGVYNPTAGTLTGNLGYTGFTSSWSMTKVY